MLRRPFVLASHLFSAIALAGVLCCAQAVELGEVTARSYRGQPLVADIELGPSGDATVQVRIANPEIYRGASIAMSPVLASVYLSVMRRDGHYYLHITSLKPVEADYLHLFLEISEGKSRIVRSAIIWLAPDPNPAPPPMPAEPPTPVAAPATLALEAAMARAAVARIDPAPPLRLAPSPLRQPACASAEQVKTCAALDYKNGLLTAQIVELEDKVKLLQAAIEAKPVPAPAPVAAVAVPVAAKVAPEVKKKPTPWLWISLGSAVLLGMIGGLVFLLLRKKPGLFARLKKGKKAVVVVAPEEPQLE